MYTLIILFYSILFYSILFYPITLGGRRGTTDEFATIPFHLDLFSAALVELAKSISVHSLILSSHLLFCLPLFLFPFTVPCMVLRWFGHVSRSSGLAKTILQGTVKGKRKRGRQKKRWEDNIKEWTGMDFASSTRAAENRSRWKGVVANSSVVPRRPSKVMG